MASPTVRPLAALCLPAVAFALRVWDYGPGVAAGNLLWMCNAANALLALGWLTGRRRLAGAAAPWPVLGIAPWLLDILATGVTSWPSVFSHAAGLAGALLYARERRLDALDWPGGMLLYLALMGAARLWTAPELNVNLAFRQYEGWEKLLPNYPLYLALTTAAAGALLAATISGLRRLYRRPSESG